MVDVAFSYGLVGEDEMRDGRSRVHDSHASHFRVF